MTLTAEQSSNKAQYEAASTAEIIDIIRTAMGEGCIRPCHVYDAVDELICRIQALGIGRRGTATSAGRRCHTEETRNEHREHHDSWGAH